MATTTTLARWRIAGGSQTPATHLLLSGGKLGVPDSDGGAFLNAYALAVVRGERPCVVELRTSLFGYFVDLDIRVPAYPGDGAVRALCGLVSGAAGTAFEETPKRVVACRAALKTESDGSTKVGVHLHWPGTVVSAKGALAVRDHILAALRSAEEVAGFAGQPWDSVVDSAVYRGSGLRMAWSGKHAGDERVYAPWLSYDNGEWTECGPVSGVTAIRDWVTALSVRVPATSSATPLAPALAAALGPPVSSGDGDDNDPLTTQSASLTPYMSVLPLLDAVLPLEFACQRFTGLVKTEHCFMLRSTARYCLNLGRAHRSNNVYFVLTRRGISQRCYCRCETTDGRKYGLCKDFVSETWAVPGRVIDTFFQDTTAAAAAAAAEPGASAALFVDDEGAEPLRAAPPPVKRVTTSSSQFAGPAKLPSSYRKVDMKRLRERCSKLQPAAAKRSKKK